MTGKQVNIIVTETSEIIFEGLSAILSNAGRQAILHRAASLCDLEQLYLRTKAELIFINPVLLQNQQKLFQSLKNEFSNLHWIGIVYTYTDPEILASFDEIINISDSPDKIIAKTDKLLRSEHRPDNHPAQENLSEREIDVLKLLVAGNANKEIADKLNISIHTVMSHRKNISQKTGIKSVSGLTIYAVVNNIISIDNYRE